MTPEGVKARLEAALRTEHAVIQAERPGGLTASQFNCLSRMARSLLDEPEGTNGEPWRGGRGTMIHDGWNDLLGRVDPGFLDGRKRRFTWDPGGGLPGVTGAWDVGFRDETANCLVELKTMDRNGCRRRADVGLRPEDGMQVAMGADAEGFAQAFCAYLPLNAGWDEAVVLEVDIPHWLAEARHRLFLADVRSEVTDLADQGLPLAEARRRVLDSVPRDVESFRFCQMFCSRFRDCRGDYVPPADLEIPNPRVRKAAQDVEHWAAVEADAKARKEAAKSELDHVAGVVTDRPDSELRVTQTHVRQSEKRRGYVATKVERRST